MCVRELKCDGYTTLIVEVWGGFKTITCYLKTNRNKYLIKSYPVYNNDGNDDVSPVNAKLVCH